MNKRSLGKAGLLLTLACLVQSIAPTTARAQGSAGWRDQVLALVNQERAAAGLNALRLSSELSVAAERYCQYMATANFFAHEGPDGSTPKTRIEAAGYSGAVVWGENIAAGQPDPQSVMQAWMNSPGHRANILFRGFTEIGIGVYSAPGTRYGVYWAQEFGARPQGAGFPSTTPQPLPSVPSLNAISPAQGRTNDVVTLTGSRFGNAAGSVSFAGILGTLVSWSDTRIQVRVPAGASSGSVYVQAAHGLSNGRGFTVLTTVTPPPAAPPPAAPPAAPPGPGTGTGSGASPRPSQPVPPQTTNRPVVTFFYPRTVRPGSRVTIYGRSLGTTRGTVLLNGTPVRVTFWYDSVIGITIPYGVATGSLVVQSVNGSVAVGTLAIYGSPFVNTPSPAPSPAPAPAPTPWPSNGGTGGSTPIPGGGTGASTPAPRPTTPLPGSTTPRPSPFTPAPAPAPSSPSANANWRDQVLSLVNQERARAGLQPLRLSAELTLAAERYSQYMATANFFAHNGPDGSTPQTRIVAAGYSGATTWGENIAAGQRDPQSVMQAWMNSPGHRANILRPQFTEIGIGIYQGGRYGIYWTQNFGARR